MRVNVCDCVHCDSKLVSKHEVDPTQLYSAHVANPAIPACKGRLCSDPPKIETELRNVKFCMGQSPAPGLTSLRVAQIGRTKLDIRFACLLLQKLQALQKVYIAPILSNQIWMAKWHTVSSCFESNLKGSGSCADNKEPSIKFVPNCLH